MCVLVHMCACLHRNQKSTLSMLFLRILATLFFKTGSLDGWKLTDAARLDPQCAPKTLLSPPLWLWDYKHLPPCLAVFTWALGNWSQELAPARPAVYHNLKSASGYFISGS